MVKKKHYTNIILIRHQSMSINNKKYNSFVFSKWSEIKHGVP